MILIGIGSNLPSPNFSTPRLVCAAAIDALNQAGVAVAGCSPWYESEPVPASEQPWFVNGVVRLAGDWCPADLLRRLHDIEAAFGRRRREVNAARVLDLDILAIGDLIRNESPILPHPRLSGRAFALYPLRDLVPGWRHPVSRTTVDQLISDLPSNQKLRRLPD